MRSIKRTERAWKRLKDSVKLGSNCFAVACGASIAEAVSGGPVLSTLGKGLEMFIGYPVMGFCDSLTILAFGLDLKQYKQALDQQQVACCLDSKDHCVSSPCGGEWSLASSPRPQLQQHDTSATRAAATVEHHAQAPTSRTPARAQPATTIVASPTGPLVSEATVAAVLQQAKLALKQQSNPDVALALLQRLEKEGAMKRYPNQVHEALNRMQAKHTARKEAAKVAAILSQVEFELARSQPHTALGLLQRLKAEGAMQRFPGLLTEAFVVTYDHLGQQDLARHVLETALETAGGSSSGSSSSSSSHLDKWRFHLGLLHLKMRHWVAAKQCFEAILLNAGNKSQPLLWACLAAANLGEYSQQQEQLQQQQAGHQQHGDGQEQLPGSRASVDRRLSCMMLRLHSRAAVSRDEVETSLSRTAAAAAAAAARPCATAVDSTHQCDAFLQLHVAKALLVGKGAAAAAAATDRAPLPQQQHLAAAQGHQAGDGLNPSLGTTSRAHFLMPLSGWSGSRGADCLPTLQRVVSASLVKLLRKADPPSALGIVEGLLACSSFRPGLGHARARG